MVKVVVNVLLSCVTFLYSAVLCLISLCRLFYFKLFFFLIFVIYPAWLLDALLFSAPAVSHLSIPFCSFLTFLLFAAFLVSVSGAVSDSYWSGVSGSGVTSL